MRDIKGNIMGDFADEAGHDLGCALVAPKSIALIGVSGDAKKTVGAAVAILPATWVCR